MKNIIFKILAPFAVLAVAMSCDKQDDTYRQYVVNGGYNYPAKVSSLTAQSGYNRVAVTWAVPLDPAVKKVTISWDNNRETKEVSYADAVDGFVTAEIDNLEERSYTFVVTNYDANGNKSLPSEITVSPYADGWLSTHAERRIVSAVMEDDKAMVSLGAPIDEMVYTQFRYKDVNGDVIISDPVPVESAYAYLPDALRGKYFESRSAYRPASGLDIVWSQNWVKYPIPILFKLPSDDWTFSVTANQQRNTDCVPAKAFDGDLETRYYSSTSTSIRKNFPKIIAVDTKAEGADVPVVSSIRVYQHQTESKSRYIKAFNFYVGNAAFNPDDAGYLDNFGDPSVDTSLTQTDAVQSRDFQPVQGRYYAIAFKNSYSANGYIDLLEFEVYGYIPSQAD